MNLFSLCSRNKFSYKFVLFVIDNLGIFLLTTICFLGSRRFICRFFFSFFSFSRWFVVFLYNSLHTFGRSLNLFEECFEVLGLFLNR
ncbi:MAG: hypothetical protein EBV35_04920 [Betaproteobacteria bacterium]|nr:hypothetical protein [Betaproteobacteria bacterium]